MTLTSAAQRFRSIAAFGSFIPAVLVGGILLGSAAPVAAQSILWARQFGSAEQDATGGGATDANGDVYVVGWGGISGQTPSGPNAIDAWVRKYNSAGTVLWTRQFGGGGYTAGLGVAMDGTDVYVVGVTNGLPGQTGGGNFLDDAFVRKYNSAGTVLWTRVFGTADDEAANSVAVDGNGNVYVTGNSRGTFPGQTSSGGMDAFLQAFNSAGTPLWTTQFGSADNEIPWDVAVDARGNATVVGFTDGALPGQTFAGVADAFVSAFDSAGAPIWTSEFGTAGLDVARRVALDAAGNAYVSGAIAGALPGQTSLGGQDAFVLAYNPSGSVLWTRQFGTAADDDAGGGITVDAQGNSYVAGNTAGTLAGQTSAGGQDAFVRAFDAAGHTRWTRQFGGSGPDAAVDVAVAGGNAYVAGLTDGALPGQTSAGARDPFLVKIGFRPPAVQALVDRACDGLDEWIADIQSQSGHQIPARRAAVLTAAANQIKVTLDCR